MEKKTPKEFGEKLKKSILNTGEYNVWEGAVRSGKTFASLLAWIIYINNSPESIFLMSGATAGSLYKNCLLGDFGFIAITGAIEKTDKNNLKYLDWNGNKIYYNGADNKSSYKAIRGFTIGGWYADEINLHDPSFIIEATNRSLASQDRKMFWTLNPSPPKHFIYTQYIDKFLADPKIDIRYTHCVMADNPAITEEARERFANQYRAMGSVYYARFILGRRVNAEGIIYSEFDRSKHVKDLPKETMLLYSNIGSDIGGNGSATSYVCVNFYFNKEKKLCIHVSHELYDDKNKSTESILNNFKEFSTNMKKQFIIDTAFTDSAEVLIKKSMDAQGIVDVSNSLKRAITDRIRLVKYLLVMGRMTISPSCSHLIEALETAVYNDKSIDKDKRLDDGTTNIDSLDSLEYAIERDLDDLMEV